MYIPGSADEVEQFRQECIPQKSETRLATDIACAGTLTDSSAGSWNFCSCCLSSKLPLYLSLSGISIWYYTTEAAVSLVCFINAVFFFFFLPSQM